jgi:O-antigen/teichoic acid export membrane protein
LNIGSIRKTRLSQKKSSFDRDSFFETDHLKGDLKGRAVRGGVATLFARSTDFAIQLFGTFILARILIPEDFGLVAMVSALTGFFSLFTDLGLTDATVQSEKLKHDQVSTLFWVNATFSFTIFLLISALSPAVAWFYKEPRLTAITIVSSLSFILAGISTQHIALIRRNMRFAQIAVLEILGATVSIAVAIIMARSGWDYWSLILRPLILSAVISTGAWIVCPWRPGLPVKGSGVRPMIGFGANTMGFYIVNYFARNMDKMLIGWRNGATILGFYSRAYYLFISPISQFCIPLQNVAVSTLTKLRNEPEKYCRYYLNALSILALVSFPVSIFMAAEGKDLILILLGPQWGPAAHIFSVLGLGAGTQILYATQGWIYVSLGRADRWLRWGIFGSIVTVLSFVAGLPFGVIGVAIGYTVSLYILVGPALWFAGKPIGLTPGVIFGEIWRYYLAAVLAGVGCWGLSGYLADIHLLKRFIICFGVFTLTYLLLIIVLYRSIEPIKRALLLIQSFFPNKEARVNQ